MLLRKTCFLTRRPYGKVNQHFLQKVFNFGLLFWNKTYIYHLFFLICSCLSCCDNNHFQMKIESRNVNEYFFQIFFFMNTCEKKRFISNGHPCEKVKTPAFLTKWCFLFGLILCSIISNVKSRIWNLVSDLFHEYSKIIPFESVANNRSFR